MIFGWMDEHLQVNIIRILGPWCTSSCVLAGPSSALPQCCGSLTQDLELILQDCTLSLRLCLWFISPSRLHLSVQITYSSRQFCCIQTNQEFSLCMHFFSLSTGKTLIFLYNSSLFWSLRILLDPTRLRCCQTDEGKSAGIFRLKMQALHFEVTGGAFEALRNDNVLDWWID